jgi:hypothetical protein
VGVDWNKQKEERERFLKEINFTREFISNSNDGTISKIIR